MKHLKLLMVLLITTALLLSVGCTSSSNSSSSTKVTHPPTITYQDQEFISLVQVSINEIVDLLNGILSSAQDYDADGLMIYGPGLKVASDNYITEIEALRVSPAFEQTKINYIKALEEFSSAGFNYRIGAEYIGKYDYTTAAEYLDKGSANIDSASEYIDIVIESIS